MIGSMKLGLTLMLAIVVAVVVIISAEAGTSPRPSLSLSTVTVKRTPPSDGWAGTVNVTMRLCASIGPRAQLLTRQWRAVGARVVARGDFPDPLGVDLDRIYPYECASKYTAGWLVPAKLLSGPGTYNVSIRVRDGYGRLSAPVSFSFHGG